MNSRIASLKDRKTPAKVSDSYTNDGFYQFPILDEPGMDGGGEFEEEDPLMKFNKYDFPDDYSDENKVVQLKVSSFFLEIWI